MAIRCHVCKPWFCVIKCEGGNRGERPSPNKVIGRGSASKSLGPALV
jgi:hypothetical protein